PRRISPPFTRHHTASAHRSGKVRLARMIERKEPAMILIARHTPIPSILSEAGLGHAIARLRSIYLRWDTARLNRAFAAELTDEQLADAGLHRAALSGNVPVIEVSASLIAELMSMR